MGLIKTIFTILIIYYSFRIIFRIFVPLVLKYFLNKAQKRTNTYTRTNHSYEEKEGSVHVSKPKQKEPSSKNVGEYVDFEEVKEND